MVEDLVLDSVSLCVHVERKIVAKVISKKRSDQLIEEDFVHGGAAALGPHVAVPFREDAQGSRGLCGTGPGEHECVQLRQEAVRLYRMRIHLHSPERLDARTGHTREHPADPLVAIGRRPRVSQRLPKEDMTLAAVLSTVANSVVLYLSLQPSGIHRITLLMRPT